MKAVGASLAAAAAVLVAVTGHAAEFDGSRVSADAEWLVHADLDALRDTEVGNYIVSRLQEGQADRKLDALEALLGFDPRTQVSDITLYGMDQERENAVMLLRGELDTARLVTLLRANDSYQMSTYGDFEIHRWTDENSGQESFGAIYGDGTIVMSAGQDMVVEALQVLDGGEPDIAESGEFQELIPDAPAAFFMAVAQLEEMGEMNTHARMLSQAQSGRLVLAERDGRFVGSLSLLAESEEVAGQIDDVARGILAMTMLSSGEKPALARMAQALDIDTEGKRITISIDCAPGHVIDFLKARAERRTGNGTDRL